MFDKREQMCKTLLRFQEYYESPKFKKKIFTLKEFKAWYAKSKGLKKFTYSQDWNGFNFPSYVLRPFYQGKFKLLTPAEKKILSTFKNNKGKFYVIATASHGDTHTKEHEIAHALFYLDKQYKVDMRQAVESLNKNDRKKFESYLKKLGYDRSVFMDETQAYIISYTEQELHSDAGKSFANNKKYIYSIFTSKSKGLKNNP